VRALPLVDGGNLKGIISQVDLISELIQVKELGQVKIKELMNIPVISVDLKTGNDQARRLMLDNDISHLPVLKDEKLEGIVTAEMLVHTFIMPASRMNVGNRGGQMVSGFSGKVGGVMDSQPLTVGLEENALNVVKEMTQRDKSACLVVDREKVLGILTPRALLQPIYDLRVEEELPVYIVGLSGEEDWFDAAVAENKVRRIVVRAQSMYPSIREIRVQIESQNTGGNRTRYEVRAHIYMKQGSETIFVNKRVGTC
jgi:CBS domain-containing protein